MLEQLDIQNIALIEQLHFPLSTGMTVLTGETGAGKSIILDAVGLILGNRANKGLVRHGEKKAVVQAAFTISESLSEKLSEMGIPEEEYLLLSRELSADGKSLCRANGMMCLQSTLREISKELIDLHGQQDSTALLDTKRQTALLDAYAKNEKEKAAYQEIYQKKRALEKEIAACSMNEQERLSRIDLLQYQVQELQAANLQPGEEADLKDEQKLLQNGEKIVQSLGEAYGDLYGDTEAPAYDRLSMAAKALEEICEFEDQFSEWFQKIEDCRYMIADIAEEISAKSDGLGYDEQRLNEIEERLDVIYRMKRKYGGDESAAISYLAQAEKELSDLTNSDERLKELEEQNRALEKELKKNAETLRKTRVHAARILSRDITAELSDLDMKNARVRILAEPGEYTKEGADHVAFLIQTNPGEAEQPLEKIASGGELSRIMLAVKMILADADSVDTLIFDEIDTGVSGSAAKRIAKKLSLLGKTKQVICISHQPQLAAAADSHFRVEKQSENNRTATRLTRLSPEERVRELARIIDGDHITELSLDHAREMIEGYRK